MAEKIISRLCELSNFLQLGESMLRAFPFPAKCHYMPPNSKAGPSALGDTQHPGVKSGLVLMSNKRDQTGPRDSPVDMLHLRKTLHRVSGEPV